MQMLRLFSVILAVYLVSACERDRNMESFSEPPREQAYFLGDGGVSEFYSYGEEIPPSPGVLLRQEPLNKQQSVSGAEKNIRLLYTSTEGLEGKQTVIVSGTLLLPSGNPPEGGWPVLLWSHGTVGIADKCAPSWTGYVPFHNEHLEKWLGEGYAIVTSDYQGLGTPGTHPYLATRPAAYSNLDVIRAVQAADFPIARQVVIAGQSQGAGAAIATAGHAPQYAPELDIRAVVATGVPFFTPDALIAVQEARPRDVVDPMLGYNFLALTLLALIDADFRLEDYVSKEALPLARGVAEICNRDMRQKIEEAGLTYEKTFIKSPSDNLKRAFEEMQFPGLALPVPVFVGIGSADRDTPPRMQSGFVKAACAAGSTIEARIYDGFDHLTVLNHSQSDSMPFVADVLRGDVITGNCKDFGKAVPSGG